jgi:Resolvase, N terminal domain
VPDKALAALEKGDTLACFKLDRLERSLAHLVKVIEDLDKLGLAGGPGICNADPRPRKPASLQSTATRLRDLFDLAWPPLFREEGH